MSTRHNVYYCRAGASHFALYFFLLLFEVFFLVFVIWLLLKVGTPVTSGPVILFVVILSFVSFALIMKLMQGYKKVEKTLSFIDANLVEAGPESIVFATPIEGEIGYYYFKGKWVSSGRSRSYFAKARFESFESLGKKIDTKFTIPARLRKKYCIIINKAETAYMMLPAIKIKTPHETCYALIIDNEVSFSSPRVELQASYMPKDFATATAQAKDREIEATLNYIGKEKSRKAVLELVAEKNVSRLGTIRAVKTLLELKNIGNMTIRHKITLGEPAIIFTVYANHRLLSIIKTIYGGLPVIDGFQDCETKLRLRLDIPFRKDVIVEKPLKLEPRSLEVHEETPF